MPFDFEPQLDAEALEIMKETRAAIHGGRAQPVAFDVFEVTAVDPETDLVTGTTTSGILSGVILVIEEQDRLLQLGGKIRVGDTKAVFLYDDIVNEISVDKLREATLFHAIDSSLPEIPYLVDVMVVEGIGAHHAAPAALFRGRAESVARKFGSGEKGLSNLSRPAARARPALARTPVYDERVEAVRAEPIDELAGEKVIHAKRLEPLI